MAAISETIHPIPGYTPIQPARRSHSTLGFLQASQTGIPAFKAMRDQVAVRLTTFPHGYGVQYICPLGNYAGKLFSKTGIKVLPFGLFHWQSTSKVEKVPGSTERYEGYDECFEKGCESAMWFKGNVDSGEVYEEEGGPFVTPHCTFLDQSVPPVMFPQEFRSYWQTTYNSATPEQVQGVIRRLGTKIPQIVTQWLHQKLENSGLTSSEINELVPHYLYETTVKVLRFQSSVDIRDFLDPIVQMSEPTRKFREETLKKLTERFGPDLEEKGKEVTPANLYKERNMTAMGIMTCCIGLCQQD